MTLDEVQTAWNEQPVRSIDHSAAREQVAKARRSALGGILLLGAVLVSASLTFWHQVTRAIADNAYTFANSSLDLAITLAGILMVIRGLVAVVRIRRNLHSLGQDTRDCLGFLIQSVRDDVRSIRWHLPLMLGGIVLLGMLSRVQLSLSGVEFTGGWTDWILVTIGVVVIYAFFRYQLRVHIRPRLETLEAIRRDLEDGI